MENSDVDKFIADANAKHSETTTTIDVGVAQKQFKALMQIAKDEVTSEWGAEAYRPMVVSLANAAQKLATRSSIKIFAEPMRQLFDEAETERDGPDDSTNTTTETIDTARTVEAVQGKIKTLTDTSLTQPLAEENGRKLLIALMEVTGPAWEFDHAQLMKVLGFTKQLLHEAGIKVHGVGAPPPPEC